jgi:hypothetical protein
MTFAERAAIVTKYGIPVVPLELMSCSTGAPLTELIRRAIKKYIKK